MSSPLKSLYILGTRGSALALWQAHWVRDRLVSLHPGITVAVQIIHTTGDRILDVPLAQIGDKGLFTREIEAALLDSRIDLAVHSLKDLPTRLPAGLRLGSVADREAVEDVLIAKQSAATLDDLPTGAHVATSSLRRRAQLLARRPDLVIDDIRGNLATRFRKFDEHADLAGMILARAGVERLGLGDRIASILPTDLSLPAVGQGALAIEVRTDDLDIARLLEPLTDQPAWAETAAERAFLHRLEGGCQVPIAALGRADGSRLALHGRVLSLDGQTMIEGRISGDIAEAESLGEKLADDLIGRGAARLLTDSRTLPSDESVGHNVFHREGT